MLGDQEGGGVLTPGKKPSRGVSLVELMIAMVIVGILLAAGIPAFSTWIQNTRIRTTAESIQNGLQLARAEAVRRNVLVQFSRGGGTSSDWTVGCTTPVDLNGDGIEDPGDCPAIIQARSASEGSTNVNVSATQDVVVFNGLGRVTPSTTATNNINITYPSGGACALAGPMRCLRIVVSSGGQVRMCDPAVSSTTDPRVCS